MSGFDNDELATLLSKRPKAELVDWIIEQTNGNTDLRQALVGFLAPQADTATLVAELNQTINKAWRRTRSSREPWKLARPIAADLEPVLLALEQLIERGQAVAAEKVLRRFVEWGDKGLNEVDDSYGYLGPLCQAAVALWGKAWASIEPRDPRKLAEMVFEGVQNNGFGIRDAMIHDFAPALGRDGLLLLKDMFEAQHQNAMNREDVDAWKLRSTLWHLMDVADALGDVNLYIELQRAADTEDVYALAIARRLFDADRVAEAFDYLERVDPEQSRFHGEDDDYTSLRVKILQALGRDSDARDTLWQQFQRTLSTSALDWLLTLTSKADQNNVSEQAITTAEGHPNRCSAAQFLIDRGYPDRAAALIELHPDGFDGSHYGSLLALAKGLQADYPAAAWELYRTLLLDILEKRRSKAYHHAADYLAVAQDLAPRAGRVKEHHALLAKLQLEHGRKRAFWGQVKA